MIIENINIAELPSVYLLEKERLPNCAAIYFVSDSKSQVIYIGRTGNLGERWKAHHRFKQLKRFNRKNTLTISWLACNDDIQTLSNLENEFIKLYKPPLNWTKVVVPIKKITPAETALQQSLYQLAKFNVMVLGFDPISDEEPPTIYLVYPVYGLKGLSGSIRTVLKAINKKASSLKWKEYKTYPKCGGKFGFWETEYNGLKIDLSPFDGLVYSMQDSNRRTLAGIEIMAFSSEQLEAILDKQEENEENTSGLEVLEDDPIPLESVYKNKHIKSNRINQVEVEPWEELEPMSEGEIRIMTRQFVYVDDVEIEVCTNENGKHFVRHNLYWWIRYNKKNPSPEYDCIIRNIQSSIDRLSTIRWSGYRFRFETIRFSEDDVEVESTSLLPLAMFEDLIKDKSRFDNQAIEQILKSDYKPNDYDRLSMKLFFWLQSNSIFSLLQTNNNHAV